MTGWAWGRRPWLVVLCLGSAALLMYATWWWSTDGPWAPFNDPRYLQSVELVPTLLGMVAIYGVSTRMNWIDGQSARPLVGLNLASAGFVVFSFGCLPITIRAALDLSPSYAMFVPRDLALRDPAFLAEMVPYSAFMALGWNVAVYLSLGFLGVACLGRAFGPFATVLALVLVLSAQGWLRVPILPGGREHLLLSSTDVVVGTLLMVAAFLAYAWASRNRVA